MYRAIHIRGLGLRGLLPLRQAPASRALTTVRALHSSPFTSTMRCIAPARPAAPSSQLRTFSLTTPESDSTSAQTNDPDGPPPTDAIPTTSTTDSTTIVRDATGVEHDLTALAKEFALEAGESNIYIGSRTGQMVEHIKGGPTALAKLFAGQMIRFWHVKLLRASEQYVSFRCNVTSPDELVNFNPLENPKGYPSTLVGILNVRGGTFSDEVIAMVEEAEALIRVEGGHETLEREEEQRVRDFSLKTSTITRQTALRLLQREKWVGDPRSSYVYLPGGPWEVVVKHIGDKLTPEIAEEIEEAEKRQVTSPAGLMHPEGPTRGWVWRALEDMGLREKIPLQLEQVPEYLESILPSIVTQEVVGLVQKAECVIKEAKNDRSEGLIPGGPGEYMASQLGNPLNDEVLQQLEERQATYLTTAREGKHLFFAGSPVYVIAARVRQKRRALTPTPRVKQRVTYYKKSFNIQNLQPVDGQETAEPGSVIKAEPTLIKSPAFLPPMEVVSSFTYNLIRMWEDTYRDMFAEELGKHPERIAASPTRVIREMLGETINLNTYNKILEEEARLTGKGNQEQKNWRNGPSLMVRRMKALENPEWLQIIRMDKPKTVVESPVYLADLEKHLAAIVKRHSNIMKTLAGQQKRLEYFQQSLKESLPKDVDSEDLLRMEPDAVKAAVSGNESVVALVDKIVHYKAVAAKLKATMSQITRSIPTLEKKVAITKERLAELPPSSATDQVAGASTASVAGVPTKEGPLTN